MKEFDELLAVADRLLGPNGCPWDLKQTFLTLQPYVLEEAHEVLEAVDSGEDKKIYEELGDLLYTVIFYAKVAEKEGRFTLEDILKSIKEKLIRRHPHIFGEGEAKNADEVMTRWEEIKKEESAHATRESALDGIPARLPSLAKAQKMLKKVMRSGYSLEVNDDLGGKLLQLIAQAEKQDLDVESELRRALTHLEHAFRKWEEKSRR